MHISVTYLTYLYIHYIRISVALLNTYLFRELNTTYVTTMLYTQKQRLK